MPKQPRKAIVVLQRAGAVTGFIPDRHQLPDDVFPQRIGDEDLLGVSQRLGQVALRADVQEELTQIAEIQIAQTLSLANEPVFVEIG